MRRPLLLLVLVFGIATGISAQTLRLAHVSDTHTTRGTKDDQPLYKSRLTNVIHAVNASSVSLVLISGDLTESGKDEEYADFREQIGGFSAPVLYVPGNHDIGGKWTPKNPDSVSTAALEKYEKFLGPTFFSRDFDAVRVIGVNSSILGSNLPQAAEQDQMLAKTLGDSDKPAILLMHYPPFRDAVDEPGGGYWSVEPDPRARFLKQLDDARNVKAILAGHLHLPLVNHYKGIPIINSHPVSFGIPQKKQPQGWTLITISAAGDLHAEFMIVGD